MILRSRLFIKIFVVTLLTFLLTLNSHVELSAQISLGSELPEIDYTNPIEYEIGGITISGVQYLDQSVLIMISGLSTGQKIKIPGDQVTQAVKKLWEQGLFENVKILIKKIENKTVFLEIQLQERPRMSKYTFTGIKKAEGDNLKDEIKLVRGEVVTDNVIMRTKNYINKYYTKKGFLNSEITIEQIKDTSKLNEVILKINVNKNKRVKISKIEITGNQFYSEDQIKGFLKKTKEKGVITPFRDFPYYAYDLVKAITTFKTSEVQKAFKHYTDDNFRPRIFKASKFIVADFEEDKETILKKYNSKGYRDARILKDTLIRDKENTVILRLDLEEGRQYYFRNINWVGNTKYSTDELNAILQIRKGDLYNQELLSTNLTYNPNSIDVSSLYLDNGYLFFNVNPVEVRAENDSIDLEIRIREGKQAIIKRIEIKGNTKTNDRVVIREIRSKPGQLFSRTDIIRTTRELAQLKFFNPEKINPVPKPNAEDGTVDIVYELEETSSDVIELSGGWGYGRIIGSLGLTFNNFSIQNMFKKNAWRPIPAGDGQKLSLRFNTYGQGYLSYSVSFTEPWLGGRKANALSLSYYHSLYSNNGPSAESRSEFKIDGISGGIGRRLQWPDDYFTLYTGAGYNTYKLKNYTSIFQFGDGNGKYKNLNFQFSLGRNSIDNPIFPRSGGDHVLSLELTPPYSLISGKDYTSMTENEKYEWIEYHKWKIETTWFTKLVDNLVVMARAKYGILGSYGDRIGVTPFERFYLGGDGLSGFNSFDGRDIIGMRGYANETLTPLYAVSRNVGGTVYTKLTMELRYPLSLNPSATIYVLGFLEAGNDWAKFQNFNPFELYRSAGFGVKVFLPMFGILGLDWGYGFDEVPGIPSANGGQFHFSINQSID